MHILKYDEGDAKAVYRPRHPIVCIVDLGGLSISLFLLNQSRDYLVQIYLLSVVLLYVCSLLLHWIRHNDWVRLLDHAMIFSVIAMTGIPLWGNNMIGLATTTFIILFGLVFKFHTFFVGENTFSKNINAVTYLLAAAPLILYFLFNWNSVRYPYNWFWVIGSVLYLFQLVIYTKHWFDFKTEFLGYREVQHVILVCASTVHGMVYIEIIG